MCGWRVAHGRARAGRADHREGRAAGGDRQSDEILKVAQGVMVARGDLGLELPLEQVPRVQKEIIRGRAHRWAVPSIVATQVLESMRVEPRPTRAEVSDAAKAVDEGVDAIMLAGETAAGLYPVRGGRDARSRDPGRRVGTASMRRATCRQSTQAGLLHSRALCEAAVHACDQRATPTRSSRSRGRERRRGCFLPCVHRHRCLPPPRRKPSHPRSRSSGA